jgi:hypothetical protein
VVHIPTDAERAAALRAAADYLVQTGVALTPLPAPLKPAAATVAPTVVENLALEVARIIQGQGNPMVPKPKKKRKASQYSKRYGKAYKQLRKKYSTKKGALRKGWNHKRLVMASHKLAKGGRK